VRRLLAAVLISCLGSTVAPAAVPPDERSPVVREYLLAIARQLPAQARDTLPRIDGSARRLLAARAYLRTAHELPSRWSWSAEEIRAYENSSEYRDLLAAIAQVREQFEMANPGFSLYANTQARSLDLQLQRWNSNASVAEVAERLYEAARRELAARAYPARPDAAAVALFAEFLRNWRPSPAAPLAAPGLSLHGRSRAIDFQITKDGQIIAPTEIAQVRAVWERQSWARKLATAVQGTKFVGPLRSPNEPWHYEYVP
jgi:hypothetical protein